MLYLIGVNHDAQRLLPGAELTDAQDRLIRCLNQAITDLRPQLLAEEESEDNLRANGRKSLVEQAAIEHGIQHKFCDPNALERRAMNYKGGDELELELFMSDQTGLTPDEIFLKARAIEIGRYFPIRERFWLDRLGDCRSRDAIFVCGDLHMETFGRLLGDQHFPYLVLQREIGRLPGDDRFYAAIEYLNSHPEVIAGDI